MSTPDTAPHPPRGWYPDPVGPHRERYWDGDHWTQVVRRSEVIEPTPWAVNRVDRPLPKVKDPALDLPLASWGRRFGSGLVDTLIGWVLAIGLVLIVSPGFFSHVWSLYLTYVGDLQGALLTGGNPWTVSATSLQTGVSTLMMVVGGVIAVYSIVFMGTWGATLGQRLCGIKVVRSPLPLAVLAAHPELTFTVQKPGWLRAFSKGLGWALFSTGGSLFILIQLANVLLPLWHRRKQSLTDLLANTLVIRDVGEAKPPAGR